MRHEGLLCLEAHGLRPGCGVSFEVLGWGRGVCFADSFMPCNTLLKACTCRIRNRTSAKTSVVDVTHSEE